MRHQWRSVALGVVAIAGIVLIALYGPTEGRAEAYAALAGIVSVVVVRHAMDSSQGPKPKE